MKEVSECFERLKKIADERSDSEYAQCENEVKLFRIRHWSTCDLSERGPIARCLRSLLNILTPTSSETVEFQDGPESVREILIAYLELHKHFPYKSWSVVSTPDPSLPDEQNLCFSDKHLTAIQQEAYERFNHDTQDLLRVFGELANKANSSIKGRVINLINNWKVLNTRSTDITTEMAKSLVDELCACWKTVLTEVNCLPDDAKIDIWPSRPTHRTKYPEDESQLFARTYYKLDLCRHLRPGTIEEFDTVELISDIEKSMTQLADEMEACQVTLGRLQDAIEGPYLQRILSFKMSYDYKEDVMYDDIPDKLFCKEFLAEGPEYPVKEKLVASLVRYIDCGRDLARKHGSKAYDLLGNCRELLERYKGDFVGDTEMEELAAARDIKTFISTLRESRKILWADVESGKSSRQAHASEPATKIAPPDFTDLRSCRKFCNDLYAEIREKLKTKVHSETQAVDYILHGARKGELYFDDCVVARQIQKDWNWSSETFKTYCKQKAAPKPKTIRRAAKKRAHLKERDRMLREL